MANNLDINLDGLTDSVNRFIKTLDLLDKRFEAFGQGAAFSRAFGTPKEVESYVASINKLDRAASNTFKNLVKEITSLQRVVAKYNAGGQGSLTIIVNELLKVTRQLGEIGDESFNVGRVTKLFEIVSIVNTKLIGLGSMDIKALDGVKELGVIYAMVGRSVKKMLEAINDLQGIDYAKLKAFTDVLGFVQTGIGKAINKGARVASVEDFRRIGTSIANLSKAIPDIIENLDKIPNTGVLFFFTKQRRQLVGFFNTVGFILQGVGKAVKKAKLTGDEATRVRQMATALLDISKAIPQLIRDSQQLPALGGWFRTFTKQRRDFGAFLGSVRFIINQLGKIKVKQGSIEGLHAITDFMTKIKAFDWRGIDYDGMDEFTKRTAGAFGRFNKMSGFKMPAMPKRASRNSYGRGDDAGVLRSASTFVGQMPNALTIAKGILIRDAVQFAIRNLGQFARYMVNYRSILLRSIKNIGDTLRQGGQSLVNAGQSFLNAFSPRRVIQSQGLNLAIEFEALISQIKVFGDLADDQIVKVKALANEVGIKFPLSANDALSAILDLIKAGRSLEEIDFLLPASATLAALSESRNLDMVTKFLINAGMNVKQISDDMVGGFQNIEAVSNVIFRAANATTASVDGLIEGMGDGILAGKALGLTLEETAAALTIFEDASIRGSEAGTALRTFEAALSKLEGRNFYEKFENALNLKSDREFGDTRAVAALRIFRDAEARGGIRALVEQFQGSKTAAEAFEETMKNLKGQVIQLQGAFETAQQVAFEPLLKRFFLPVVKITQLVIEGFVGLDESFRETLVTTGLLTIGLGALAGAIMITSGLVMQLSGGFTSLVASAGLFILKAPLMIFSISSIGAATITAVSSLALLGGGLLLIGATVTKFYRIIENNVGGAGSAFREFGESVGGLLSALGEAFKGLQVAFDVIFGKSINDERTKEGERISGFFETMTLKVQEVTDAVRKFDPFKFLVKMKPIINQLREGFSDIGAGILGVISGDDALAQQGARGLATYGRIMSRTVGNIFGVGMEDAVYAFDTGKIVEGFRLSIKNLANGFETAVLNNSEQISNAIATFVNFINPFSKVSSLFRLLGLDGIADATKGVANEINKSFASLFSVVTDLFSGKSLVSSIEDNFGSSGAVSKIFNPIIRTLQDSLKSLQNFVSSLNIDRVMTSVIDSFVSIFDGTEKPLTDKVASFLRAVIDGASSTILRLPEYLFNAISNFVRNGLSSLGNLIGGRTQELLSDSSASIFRLVGRFIGLLATEIPKAIVSFVSSVFDVLQKTFSDEAGNFSFVEFARQMVKGLYSIGRAIFVSIGDLFSGIGEGAGSSFITGIGNAIRNFSFGELVKTLVIAFSDALIFFDRLILESFGINTEGLRNAFAGIAEVVGSFLQPIFDIFTNAIRTVIYLFDALTGKSDEVRIYALAIGAAIIYLTRQFKPFQNAVKAIGITIGQFFPIFRKSFERIGNLVSGLRGRLEKLFPVGDGEKSPLALRITTGIDIALKRIKKTAYDIMATTKSTLSSVVKETIKSIASMSFSAITNLTFFGRLGNRLAKEGFGFSGFKQLLFSGFVSPIKQAINQVATSIREGNIQNGFSSMLASLRNGITNTARGFANFGVSVARTIKSMTMAFFSSPMIVAFLGGTAFSALGTAISDLTKNGDVLKSIATFMSEILYSILGIFGLDRSQLSWIEDIFDGITSAIRDIFDWIAIKIDESVIGTKSYAKLTEKISVGTEIVTEDPRTRWLKIFEYQDQLKQELADFNQQYGLNATFEVFEDAVGQQRGRANLIMPIGSRISPEASEELRRLSEQFDYTSYELDRIGGQISSGLQAMTPQEQLNQVESYFEEIANLTNYGTEATEVLRNRRDAILYSFGELVTTTGQEFEGGLAGYFESLIGTDQEWRIRAVTGVLEGAGMIDQVATLLGRDSKAFGLMFESMSAQNRRKYINDYLNGSFRVDLENTNVPSEILSISQDLQEKLRDGLIDDEFYGDLSEELTAKLEEIYADQLAGVRQMTGGMAEGATIESFSNEFSRLQGMGGVGFGAGGFFQEGILTDEFMQQLLETAASIDVRDQQQIETFNTYVDSIKGLDETQKAFYKTLAVTNRDFVKGLFPDVETIKETRAQEETVNAVRNSYEDIIDLAKELESGAVNSDNIGEFVEKLLLMGGAEEANTEAYGVVLEQLRALEEAGLLTEGTANAVDNYFRLVRQGRANLDGLGFSQDEINKKLQEYLRLMGAVDESGVAVLPTPISATTTGTDEATDEMQTRLEELQAEFDAEIADFDKEYLDKEKERQQELLEMADDFRNDQLESQQDYDLDRRRALQDHLREMKSIGDNDFKDAVANRNAAQALEAMQRQQEAKEQFDLSEQRANEDYQLELQRKQREYDLKVAKIREQQGLDFHQYHVERQARLASYQQRLRDEGLYDLYMRNIQQRRLQELANFATNLAQPFINAAQTASSIISSLFSQQAESWNPFAKQTPKAPTPNQAGFAGLPIVIPPKSNNTGFAGLPNQQSTFGFGSIQKRQKGGMTFAGKTYSVIEDDKPELFVPGKTGRITSYNELKNLIAGGNGRGAPRMAMSGGGDINIDLSGMQFNGMENSQDIVRKVEAEIVPRITRAIRDARRS